MNTNMIRPKSTQNFKNSFTTNTNKTFFNDNKNATLGFFKDTRVGSCSHIVELKNRTVAIPYTIINSKGRPLCAYKYVNNSSKQQISVYMKDYSIKKNMHAGMSKKPLIHYNPNSYRSRLPQADFYSSHKNLSNIEVGSKTLINNKQWLSTTRDSYKWPIQTPITNSGILSDKAKLAHKKLTSIN
jgi:hypothetical protein